MIMADVFKILFLILGALITLVCYWLLFEACVPRRVARARRNYERRPIRTTLLGALVSVPVIAIGLLLLSASRGPFKLTGVTLLMFLAVASLVGSTGLTSLIGERLASPLDGAQPWRRVMRGGAVLSVSFVLPFVGWFLALPLTLISGVGAFISSAPTDTVALPIQPVSSEAVNT